ncbi:MAG TPA: protein kinase [Candidatus Polarisedimenticolia bacterium]|nr:protein kinase [Candidatus Polarisedimenticolia bacterium]
MPLQPGQTLGHYRIVRPLGAGGMGEVYEAQDTKLGRKIAIKVLPEETARDPQRRERFEREAKAIAALNHPGIVTIYSVEEAGGVDFITMELLEGQTLRRSLPHDGLSFDRFLAISVPLADAMAAAHQQGITHRDLKPENIVITADGRLKVLDFGLAKGGNLFEAAGAASAAPTRALTEEGRIVGTVAYMSPEQAEGKPVDPRSDVFALGIIFYEMCTGERPFRGDTTVSILSSILKDTPPPVTQANVTLPRDVARIVNRCLMKDPTRRFQSAVGLSTELTELKHESDSGGLAAVTGTVTGAPMTRGATVSAPAISGAAATRSGGATLPGSAAPGGLRYAAIAAAVLVLGAAGYFLLRGRTGIPTAALPAPPAAPALPGSGAVPGTPARQRIAVLPFENLGAADDAYFADGVTEEITSRLASVGGLGVISRNSAAQYAKTTKTTRQIGSELNVDYVLTGTVRWQRAAGGASRVRVTPQLVRVNDDTQLWGDRYDREMKDIFKVQSEIAEQVVGKLGLAMRPTGATVAGGAPPTDNLDAYQVYLRGKAIVDRTDLDRKAMLEGIGLMEQSVQLDPRFAQGWAALAKAHSSAYLNHFDFSEDRLAKARECADRALALQPDLREGHLALGYYYYWGRRDYTQAAVEFSTAAGGREDDPETLAAMGYMMRRQGKWQESLAALEKAYALNPRDIELIGNLATTYASLWRYSDALRLSDVMLELTQNATFVRVGRMFLQLEMDGDTRAARKALDSIDPSTFPEIDGLRCYLAAMDGRYEEALKYLRAFPSDVIESPTFYSPKSLQEGLIYLAMNDRARAEAACELARQRLEKEVAASPRDARLRSGLGLALACLGRKEEAVREARLAVDLLPVSADAVDGPNSLNGLAQVYTLVGDYDAALDVLDKYLLLPGSTGAGQIRVDPGFEPLRKLPRFQKLLERPH